MMGRGQGEAGSTEAPGRWSWSPWRFPLTPSGGLGQGIQDPSLGERGTLPSCLALLIFPEVPLGEERLRGVAALASGVGTGSGVLVRRHVFSETALASGILE